MDDELTHPGASFDKKYSTTFVQSEHVRSSSSLLSNIFNKSHLRFFLTSPHEMVIHHRDIVMAAAIPIIYDLLLFIPVMHPDIGDRYVHAATFVSILAFVYSLLVIKKGLVPRSKTYGLWNSYMETAHPKLNDHVREVLLVYYRQTMRGSQSHLDLLRSTILAFESEDVRSKYVNFCWKFAYRLWMKERQIQAELDRFYKEKLFSSRTQLPRARRSEPANLEPAVSVHGDIMDHPMQSRTKEPEKPLSADNDEVSFRVLRNLTQRVNRYAEEKGLSEPQR